MYGAGKHCSEESNIWVWSCVELTKIGLDESNIWVWPCVKLENIVQKNATSRFGGVKRKKK